MAYVNTTHFNEGETEPSNYSELTQRDEGDVSYSTIHYGRRTETVGLSAANLEPFNTVQRTNIHTGVIEQDVIEKSTDQLSVKRNCQNFNLKLIMIIVGMIVIAAVSSTITALLLKQNFDHHLTKMREEIDSKQDIGQAQIWSEWLEWSSWGACSATCNGGIQSRVRTCDVSEKEQQVCVGNTMEISACIHNTCVEQTWSEWLEWSSWGACSATCNGGIQRRVRTCDISDKEQYMCVGTDVDISTCNNNTCVVPMVYFTMTRANSQLVSGKVKFSTTVTNVGNGYNKQTGEFVCPVAGLYHFFFSFVQKSTTYVLCYIKHNDKFLTRAYTSSDGTWDAASTSAYIQLAVGDVVFVGNCENWQYVDNGGSTSVFTGSLIHL